ncbi:MAG: hypothetical protein NC918_01810 [Candidatus Omnitrophica bacterium]|nr:hypothetical protein [Candidatus Omnitrophota bacterium]
MAKKYSLQIIDKKISCSDFKLFDISFSTSFLGVQTETFDLRSFYKKKYLTALLLNFKDEKNICYLLFTAIFREYTDYLKEQINYLFYLSASVEKILEVLPKKKFFIQHSGKIVYLLTLEEIHIRNTIQILSCLDLKELEGSTFYFIYDLPQHKKDLRLNIEKFCKNNVLDDNNIISLLLEFIKIKFGNEEIKEEFKIFTCRFDQESIKNIILDSTFLDSDKFEVICK